MPRANDSVVYVMNRYSEQVETVSVSVESIMRRADFKRGVDDARSGHPPRFDSYVTDSHDDRAYNDVNRLWDYEARTTVCVSGPYVDGAVKVDGRLNPKAVTLFRVASWRG
jgi:hypothetical protein